MKIGIFDPYLDTLGGGEKYMLTIALCLSEHHNVSIFWDKNTESIKEQAKKRFGFDLQRVAFAKNIFSSTISFMQRVKEARKYDVVIFLSDGAIPLLIKKNLILHFQFPVEWVNPSFFTRVKFLFVKNVICNSFFTKGYIDKTFGIVSNVVYPPVDQPKENLKKENIILNVGRFSMGKEGKNYKKQDVMIDFFREMIGRTPDIDWKFVLIISVREQDQQKVDLLREKVKGASIEIIENPTYEKLWEMYNIAKIYWHASGFGEDLAIHPERAEHFGIATAEAMRAGCVPVVIDAGGQKEIVKNGENGFLWSSEEKLIEKTMQLIIDRALLKKLSASARESAKQFSIERFAKDIEKEIDI